MELLNNEVAKLKEKYGEGIILFHSIGFNYECLANDAKLVNKECGVELEREAGTTFCSFSPAALKKTIAALSKKGHSVGVLGGKEPRVILPIT